MTASLDSSRSPGSPASLSLSIYIYIYTAESCWPFSSRPAPATQTPWNLPLSLPPPIHRTRSAPTAPTEHSTQRQLSALSTAHHAPPATALATRLRPSPDQTRTDNSDALGTCSSPRRHERVVYCSTIIARSARAIATPHRCRETNTRYRVCTSQPCLHDAICRRKSCASTSTALSMHFAALPHALAEIRTGQHTTEINFRTQGPRLSETSLQPDRSRDGDGLLCAADGNLPALRVYVAVVPWLLPDSMSPLWPPL